MKNIVSLTTPSIRHSFTFRCIDVKLPFSTRPAVSTAQVYYWFLPGSELPSKTNYSDLISSANRFYRPLCGPDLMTFDQGNWQAVQLDHI